MHLSTPAEPEANTNEAEIWRTLRSQRPDGKLIALDLALLHNPHLAQTFYAYNEALHTTASLPLPIRSLAICRVAVLCQSSYSWNTHSAIALKRGLDPKTLAMVRELDENAVRVVERSGDSIVGLSERESIVLLYTDQVTRSIKARETTLARLKGFFNDRQILELTVAIGEYNAVCRLLVNFEIGLDVEANVQWNEVKLSPSDGSV